MRVDKRYPQFGTHNIFMAGEYRQYFDQIFQHLALPDAPCFYVHTPVNVDPSLAPEGQDTVMVAVPVGHTSDGASQGWTAIQNRTR